MKTVSSGLRALLGTNQFYMADCYTFFLQSGAVAYYTSADANIYDSIGGVTFLAGGPKFSRSKITWHVGVQVDTIQLIGHPGPNDLLDGTPWLVAARYGTLDGAELLVQRAFMPTFNDTTNGLVTIFRGRIQEIQLDRQNGMQITADTHLELLSLQMPQDMFQSGCRHVWGDLGCQVNTSSYAVSGTVNAASSISQMFTNLTQADGYFSLGTLIFTSGALNGENNQCQQYLNSGGIVQVSEPFDNAPQVGDTFTIYPGCDKQMTTCSSKFSNLINFGGQPFIPIPETAL